MNKVAFYTLGCKVNQYDTEAMIEIFEDSNYEIVSISEVADIYVINTCTVTSLSDRKSRQFIRRCKKLNNDSKIVVVGCYAQTSPDEVMAIDGVNLIIGTNDRSRIVELVEGINSNEKINYVNNIMSVNEFEELSIDKVSSKTRAFLKIQEGCNQFCAYCIIPYARGPIRSRLLDNVVSEVERLSHNGFKEVVLTGIHIASYGKDLKNTSLIDVIKEVHNIEGIERIRLSSIEPTLLTENFVNEISKLHKFCHHLHISLQSGSNNTLKRMNRKYSTEEYEALIKGVRMSIPNIAITTDIIVGFPGETEAEFNETYDFLKKMAFSQIHVFKYSPRKGTPAAEFQDQIPSKTKNIRSDKIINLGNQLMTEFRSEFIGSKRKVLFEDNYDKDNNMIAGLTDNYIRVIASGDEKNIGKVLDVRLNKIDSDIVCGEILNI